MLAIRPSGFVTTTSTVPAECEAVIAVIVVLLLIWVEAAGTPPNLTVVPETKPCPLITTLVPPAAGPEFGTMAEMFGVGSPELCGIMTVSFFNNPGALVRYDCGDNMI